MPKQGRCRKAKPIHVWEAFREQVGDFIKVIPKPGKNESFASYMARIDWKEEAVFKAVIGVGCTKDGSDPTQRDMLFALDDMTTMLYKLKDNLYKMWPR